MGEKDWRIEGAYGLMSLLLIVIVCEFFIVNKFTKKNQNDFDKLATSTAIFLQSEVDGIKDCVSALSFPSTIDYNSSEDIKKYLKTWVESFESIDKVTFVSSDGRVVDYSLNNRKTNADFMPGSNLYNSTVYNLGINYISSYEDKKVLYTKSVFDFNRLKGILVFEVPYDVLFNPLNNLSLDSEKYNIVIRDTFGNVIFGNEEIVEPKSFNPNRFTISNFATFFHSLNIFNTYFDTKSFGKLESNANLENEFASINLSSNVNIVSYYVNTRIVFYCIFSIIIIFLCMIFLGRVITSSGKAKLYLATSFGIQVILIVMIFIETTNMMHIYNRTYSLESTLIARTVEAAAKLQNNQVSLYYTLLSSTNEYNYANPDSFDKLINDYYLKFKLKFPETISIALIRDDKIVSEYPNSNGIYSNYMSEKRNIHNVYTYYFPKNTEYISYHKLPGSNTYLAVKNKYKDFLDIGNAKNLFSAYHLTRNDGEILTNDKIFDLLVQNNIAYNVDDNLEFVELFKNNVTSGVFFGRNNKGNIVTIYNQEEENYIDDFITIGICAFVLVFMVEVVVYSNAVRMRKRKENYEETIREENRNLDKLLSKINEDVSDINRAFKFDDDIE